MIKCVVAIAVLLYLFYIRWILMVLINSFLEKGAVWEGMDPINVLPTRSI